jgi:hypothetical protein
MSMLINVAPGKMCDCGVVNIIDCTWAKQNCRATTIVSDMVPETKQQAIKFDQGKPRFDLIPPDAMTEIAKVFTMGADKYEARNWEKGTNWGRSNAAMLRHIMAWMACEDNDPESGLNHMAHVAWGAMCLLAYQLRGVGEDDRYDPQQPLAYQLRGVGEDDRYDPQQLSLNLESADADTDI